MIPTVAVVGAGWAGLAAAVDLVDAGARVVVFEATPQAGGRARAVELELDGRRIELDNGQHLMMGAYRECLRLVRRVAGDERSVLQRNRLCLRAPGGLHLAAPGWLPAPLHLAAALISARGLSASERIALIRALAALRARRWQVPEGGTVRALLERLRQPAALVSRIWAPLCVSALNTRMDEACARTFATVLRDTLGASRADSDFLVPRATLSDVFPRPALRWLIERGAQVLTGTPIRTIDHDGSTWQVHGAHGHLRCDSVVLAVAPAAAVRLLAVPMTTPARELVAALAAFDHDHIATVYLAWPTASAPRLPQWTMLADDDTGERPGQWLFDRGCTDGLQIASVVVSAAQREQATTPGTLCAAVADQVCAQLGVPWPTAQRAIIEKRATFRCRPDRPVIEAHSAIDAGWPALWLAGDHVLPGYPATLESAVRSGALAARGLLQALAAPGVPAAPRQSSQAESSACSIRSSSTT